MDRSSRHPEDIFDSALQSVLDGATIEEALIREPGATPELEQMLRVTGALRSSRVPEMSNASIAALLSRVQEQTLRDSVREQGAAPALAPGPLSHDGTYIKAAGVQTSPQALGLAARIGTWLRVPASTIRAVAIGMISLALVFAGLLLADIRPPVQLPVTQLPEYFTHEGVIRSMSTGSWVVGTLPIYLDEGTTISGEPLIGKAVRVEGEIEPGDRRVARRIIVSEAPPITGTTVPATIPAGGTEITTPTQVAPKITPPLPAEPSAKRPQSTGTAVRAETTRVSTAGSSFTPTTVILKPTGGVPSPVQASSTPWPTGERTHAVPTASQPPASTSTPVPIHPTPIPSFTPLPLPSASPTGVTQNTALPRPTGTSVSPTAEPTEEPDETPQPEPSEEPEETPSAQPSHSPESRRTPTAEPTEEPDPTEEAYETPQPGPTPTEEDD